LVFPIGERTTLCIDWDDRSLRVVEASFSRSGVRLRRAIDVPLDSGVNVRNAASLGDFLRKTLAQHRIRARKAIVDVPRQDAVLNAFTLPRGSRDDLAAMVHVQIGKELPFSKDEAVIDFAVVPGAEGATMVDLWVAAVRRKVIDHYQQVMTAAGLKLERIGLRPYANTMSLDLDLRATGRTLMVDVGPSMTEINVIRDGYLVYSRAASVSISAEGLMGSRLEKPAGSAPGPSDRTIPFVDDSIRRPSSMELLLIEVSRTIQAYHATDVGATIDRIVLAGMLGTGEQVVEAFADRFGFPTQLYEAPSALKWASVGKETATAFSAVLGLALSNEAEAMLHFDFLHPKEPEAEHRQRVRRRPMVVAVVALFVAAGGVAAYQPIRSRNIEIVKIKAAISTEKEGEKERGKFLKQLADLEAYRGGHVVWLDSIKMLADIFPSNQKCYITEVEFKNTGRIPVEVAAVNELVATEVVTAVTSVLDEQGKRVFDATSGNKTGVSKDPKYPVSDEVLLEIRSLLSKRSTGRGK